MALGLAIFIAALLFIDINCQTPVIYNLGGVSVTVANRGSLTDFYVTTSFAGSSVNVGDSWLGVGVNTASRMDGTNVVICRYGSTTQWLRSYLNTGYSSAPFANDQLGLTNTGISIQQGNLTFRFTRANSNPDSRYISVNTTGSLFVIVAFGSGDVGYHGSNQARSGSTTFQLVPDSVTIVPQTTTTPRPTTTQITTTRPTTTSTVTATSTSTRAPTTTSTTRATSTSTSTSTTTRGPTSTTTRLTTLTTTTIRGNMSTTINSTNIPFSTTTTATTRRATLAPAIQNLINSTVSIINSIFNFFRGLF